MIFINKLIKIISITLCLVMCLQISVFADDEITTVIDTATTISETEITEEETTEEESTTSTDEEKIVENSIMFDAIEEEYSKLEEDIQENQEQLDDVNKDINTGIQKLAIINSQVDVLNNQIKLLNTELNSLNFSIELIDKVTGEINTEIKELETSIKETDKEIKELEPQLDKATDELLDIIRNEYLCGTPSLLEVLFTSTTMVQYFTVKEIFLQIREDKEDTVKEVSTLNKQLTKDKEEMVEKKAVLENDKKIIAEYETEYSEAVEKQKATQNSLYTKKAEVTEKKNEVKEIISELDTESEEYKAQIQKDREEMEILSEYVDNYISEYGSKLDDVPDVSFENTGSMIWPVNFESYITAGYPAYSDGSAHWGIDICAVGGNTAGKPFNAAQGGKVVLAVNDNNYNNGFGNYCVVDHGDGTSTLYAHAKNLVVSKGDVVRQGETLGYIGSTGNTTGPHLHFEVRINNSDGTVSRVNPLNYVKNTTK